AGRIGQGASASYVLLGPAVAQAQRLLALARPGETLCSAAVADADAHIPGSAGAYSLVPLQPLNGAPPDERPFRVTDTVARAPHTKARLHGPAPIEAPPR
ncbi:MAG: hypothetical protein H7Y32_06060, partial [Chloroflexales bacterium]|nr:hypothetical protein [Chloroflexales bacterium]